MLDLDIMKEKKDYAITKSFYDKDYDNVEEQDIRKLIGVKGYKEKSFRTATVMMLGNGMNTAEIKSYFSEWNENNDATLDQDIMYENIDKAVEGYNDTIKWGKDPYVSEEDYRELFKMFNIDDDKVPDFYNEWNQSSKSFSVNSLMRYLENEAKKEEKGTQHMVDTMDSKIKQKAKYASKESRAIEAKKKKSTQNNQQER